MEPWKIEFYKDQYMAKIFASIVDAPKTAQQIAEECRYQGLLYTGSFESWKKARSYFEKE
jgi:hypothetical protein